uniref:Uncharacterized protein n=1 Tax=Arundo donax TaxID=35708 RepID=A0A0A9E9K0_ARUDO
MHVPRYSISELAEDGLLVRTR